MIVDMKEYNVTEEMTENRSLWQVGPLPVFCPGFQKGRMPSEKGTLAR